MSTTTSTSSGYSASGATVNQYGFFFDQSRCIACETCAVTCKEWNLLAPGPTKWLRMYEWDTGSFPNLRVNTLFAPCYHCANPVCIPAANGAMYKEPKYGAVLIDPEQATSANLRAAWNACPYGAIAFDSDATNATASKCTMCIDRLEQSLQPVCVMSCMMRALDFGVLSALKTKYPNVTTSVNGMPAAQGVNPSIIFKQQDSRSTLVSYDPNAALTLLSVRPAGLPPVFNSATDVTTDPNGIAGRQTLNMKTNSAGLMRATMDDYS
ncbi:MAG: 4Fe-4S dicluster domain-containing protein [Nitrososphaerales archaeon]